MVVQGAPPIGLRVGEMLLSTGRQARRHPLHMFRQRADRPDGVVSGTVRLSVDGIGSGQATLDNRTLTGTATGIPYQFRYYPRVQADWVLPPGFKPKHLTVTVRTRQRPIAPLIETCPWNVICVP